MRIVRAIGQNGKHIHIRAKNGSGGVGFVIKESLLESYNINIIDDEHEGILWLKILPRHDGPIESTRNIDGMF